MPTDLAAHHAAVQGQHHGRAVAEVDGVVVHQEVSLTLAQLPELADAVDIKLVDKCMQICYRYLPVQRLQLQHFLSFCRGHGARIWTDEVALNIVRS